MESVIVQMPAEAGGESPAAWNLGPGDSILFGRGGGQADVDLVLADPGVPRLAGQISAAEDFWLLTNMSRSLTYVVENPEGGGEFVKVAPGRTRAPISFEFARLAVPVSGGSVDLLVFAPAHSFAAAPEAEGGESTLDSFSLDPSAKYFQVLVALCEPKLREPSTTAIPTDAAIAERLRAVVGDMTSGAVGFHVAYLAEHKLQVREREDDAGRMREAVVSLALRYDLVGTDDLRLLPDPS